MPIILNTCLVAPKETICYSSYLLQNLVLIIRERFATVESLLHPPFQKNLYFRKKIVSKKYIYYISIHKLIVNCKLKKHNGVYKDFIG